MIYGLYLSSQGADAQSTRLDVISNNLANASTSAFKRDLAVFQALDPHDVKEGVATQSPGQLNDSTGGVALADVYTDFANGPLTRTGGQFDVALAGPGFLKVSDGQQEFLTRNGRLGIDNDGYLVSEELGMRVLSSSGAPLEIPADAGDIEVAPDGTLYTVSPSGQRTSFDTIGLFQPDSLDDLQKVGNSLYRAGGEVASAGGRAQIKQGFLEASGTNSVTEMVEMIGASRAFETNVNMIKYQDEALGLLLQAVPQR